MRCSSPNEKCLRCNPNLELSLPECCKHAIKPGWTTLRVREERHTHAPALLTQSMMQKCFRARFQHSRLGLHPKAQVADLLSSRRIPAGISTRAGQKHSWHIFYLHPQTANPILQSAAPPRKECQPCLLGAGVNPVTL